MAAGGTPSMINRCLFGGALVSRSLCSLLDWFLTGSAHWERTYAHDVSMCESDNL